MLADYRPYTIIAELTYRCPLQCLYCSNPVDDQNFHDELPTAQWLTVFRQAEALGVVHLNLTGGEPLLRDDLESLIAEAKALQLYTYLVMSGVPLTHDRLIRLTAAGLCSIQLSIPSLRRDGMTRMTGGPWVEHKSQVAEWITDLNLLRNRDVLLPTRLQLEASRVIALEARDRLRGSMEVVFVWPDYYREFPKSCMNG
jgi:PqqA peptide cyclase